MTETLPLRFKSELFFRLFADAVRTKRQQLDITQLELIALLKDREIKVSQAYLSQIEAGQRREPSARIVVALASVLEISLDKIISLSGDV